MVKIYLPVMASQSDQQVEDGHNVLGVNRFYAPSELKGLTEEKFNFDGSIYAL